jgi:hypothetical protein
MATRLGYRQLAWGTPGFVSVFGYNARAMSRWVLAFLTLCLLTSLSACTQTSPKTKEEPREQDLRLTYGGFIYGGPQDQKLDGICGPDWTRNALECDIYNGLPNWKVTEITLRVAWDPYGDDNVRLFRQRVSIPPLTTEKVTVMLGTRLPNDTIIGKQPAEHWNWLIVAAKALRE